MQLKEKESRSPQDQLLDVTEASEYTRLAKQTLYDYVHKDKIPYLKVGKKLVFKVGELDRWIGYGGDTEASERVIKERV